MCPSIIFPGKCGVIEKNLDGSRGDERGERAGSYPSPKSEASELSARKALLKKITYVAKLKSPSRVKKYFCHLLGVYTKYFDGFEY